MDRERLENLTLGELQEEAASYRLVPSQAREKCIELIMDHLEKYGPLRKAREGNTCSQIPCSSNMTSTMGSSTPPVNSSVPMQNLQPERDSPLQQMCMLLVEQSRQQQLLFQQMFAALNINRDNGQDLNPRGLFNKAQNTSFGSQDRALQTPISSVSTAHAVNLLSNHIPEFNGTEEEDVEAWIQTIERVAHIHGVSNDILLLAATGKLKNIARKWFDLNISTLIESWVTFKDAIIRRFKRIILFHVAMQKVEARRWNYIKESFQDYATDKMILMKNLKLPEDDTIHLLINGIASRSLREVAAALKVKSVDEFLEEMQRITSSSGEVARKTPPIFVENQKDKDASQAVTTKEADQSKELPKDSFCAYCRAKGHTKLECFKLKRKEKNLPKTESKATSSSVSAVDQVVQPSAEASPSTSKDTLEVSQPSTVAVIADNSERRIELCDSQLKVVFLNNNACNIVALLDTGSPVSFIYIKIDFDDCVKDKLIHTIIEVEETEVPPITDDYLVKVVLKDESVFAYSPRKFAWSERQQMREITDDLLKRGIIKYSASPYCARVVPVRKKSGALRLCVDLRPLNDRVIKQRYPFPLIEDCLARLSNKKIFTLLDIKDGFH
ncbi:hypothetical protein RF55_11569 [Lasius niger]|uniref:Uncharacterized protein n=1 Tax=Lasius niger TaxID=67767 RepID=A0A0J7KF20_LASNI|nr:hypothetical protein RF55_11569 [Lasius niger]